MASKLSENIHIGMKVKIQRKRTKKILEGVVTEILDDKLFNENGIDVEIDNCYQENVNKLGNMTLLNKSRNRSLSNSSFASKKDNYRTDDLEITKQIAKEPVWDDGTIANRQEYFLNFAKKIWDLKFV